MSDSVQMTLIADTPTAGDAAGLGLSGEQDLAAAAWAVVRRGALAELSEPEAALVGQLSTRPWITEADTLTLPSSVPFASITKAPGVVRG